MTKKNISIECQLERKDFPNPNFKKNGNLYLVSCFNCDKNRKENWGPAVATGKCAWCGWQNIKETKIFDEKIS